MGFDREGGAALEGNIEEKLVCGSVGWFWVSEVAGPAVGGRGACPEQ